MKRAISHVEIWERAQDITNVYIEVGGMFCEVIEVQMHGEDDVVLTVRYETTQKKTNRVYVVDMTLIVKKDTSIATYS